MTRRPWPLLAYAAASRLAEPLAPLLLQGRVRRGKEDPLRVGERLGGASAARPAGPLAWLHGASVGESLSLLPLATAIARERPDVNLLVTSGTLTSARLLAERLPGHVIHQFAPVDAPGPVRRFLDHWRADLAVLVESELWPNLLLEARARGTRTALLSARLSDASFRNWRRAPRSAALVIGGFDLILAQDIHAAERLRTLGGSVAGLADLKFGAELLPADPARLADLRGRLAGRPLILAASTHPGEDELMLEAFDGVADAAAAPLLVLVPRHPERGAAVADLVLARGHAVSRHGAGGKAGDAPVHVADALGELGLWFRLARLAVIGGGFVPGVGGHNPLEPARLSCPFVSGPHVDNWATAYAELAQAGAGAPIEPEALAGLFAAAVTNDPDLTKRAARARAYVEGRDVEVRDVPARILALLP